MTKSYGFLDLPDFSGKVGIPFCVAISLNLLSAFQALVLKNAQVRLAHAEQRMQACQSHGRDSVDRSADDLSSNSGKT